MQILKISGGSDRPVHRSIHSARRSRMEFANGFLGQDVRIDAEAFGEATRCAVAGAESSEGIWVKHRVRSSEHPEAEWSDPFVDAILFCFQSPKVSGELRERTAHLEHQRGDFSVEAYEGCQDHPALSLVVSSLEIAAGATERNAANAVSGKAKSVNPPV